jgi:hypothetical protein
MRVTPGAPDENLARAEAWMARAAAEAQAPAESLPGPRSQRLCSADAEWLRVLDLQLSS